MPMRIHPDDMPKEHSEANENPDGTIIITTETFSEDNN